MADWDEIKRLAADFQRTQTSDTLQRISERNCIDIVKKLTELNLIELIYTCDGKEFITPVHLLKEIEDAIYCNAGRAQVHDLASKLNVDYQHVENKVKELVREQPEDYSLVLGQIIHSSYKNTLGKQISDCMLTTGQLSIADFAKYLDLPAEFLLSIVKELLPKVVDDYVIGPDERVYYSADMMNRYKSTIAGSLSAVNKPFSLVPLIKRLDIPERIFLPTLESLIKSGRLDATLENKTYTPAAHARQQMNYIDNFYSSNSYISYDVLARMQIKQPKSFLKRRFPTGIELKTCFVSPQLVLQVESLVEDSIASDSWIDISTSIPSSIVADDIDMLLAQLFKKNKQLQSSCMIFEQTYCCSMGFIDNCRTSFNKMMEEKAADDLKHGKLMTYFLGVTVKKPLTVSSPSTKTNEETTSTNEEAPSSETIAQSPESKKTELDADKNAIKESQDMTPVDKGNKKDRKDKKNRTEDLDLEDSDDETGKKSKSRKSGGGTQGREIKQKATKKKYIPGNKSSQKANDDSEDETQSNTKTPRSLKGRAARRAMSPERPASDAKSKQQSSKEVPPKKEPIIFMTPEKLMSHLSNQHRGSEGSDSFFENIVSRIKTDLDQSYEKLARNVLDEYLSSQGQDIET